MPAVLPQVQGGRVRALGVSSVKRSAAAQDIPAVSESLPGFDMTVWFGFLAPKGTPADIVARLNAEMNRALKDTGFQSQLAGMGVTPMPGSSAEFGSFIRREMTHWAKVVKDSGAKID
ncbi:MAG: tripartite tricarboxylate transporter substrate-binding protein, partial [Rubrivivax sp.]|nr:tripartite tricarboxylate transporter substrate-binding protein [Rubrivivax sp.]